MREGQKGLAAAGGMRLEARGKELWVGLIVGTLRIESRETNERIQGDRRGLQGQV